MLHASVSGHQFHYRCSRRNATTRFFASSAATGSYLLLSGEIPPRKPRTGFGALFMKPWPASG